MEIFEFKNFKLFRKAHPPGECGEMEFAGKTR